MNKEQLLAQLISIQENSESFIYECNSPEDNKIWEDDVIAINIVIELVNKHM